MAWIDGERREHRKDLRFEKLIDPLQFSLVEVAHRVDLDPVLCQLGQQDVVQALPLLLHEVSDSLGDSIELLAGSQSVGRNLLYSRGNLTPESGDPHHIKLVEIRAEDREEFDALE